MKLIDEIVDILSARNGLLSDALLKTKVLLHKIGHKELVTWVNKELSGYEDDDDVPDYRIVPAQVLVNASNGFHNVSRHPIPLGHLDQNYRNILERGVMPHSLAVIEQFTASPNGSLESPIPMEANGLLGRGLASGFKVQKAWCDVPLSSATNILVQVRSRLLDFVLDLSNQFQGLENEEEMKVIAGQFDAANSFNNTIFGDNTTIVVGTRNTQTVTNNITKNNFEKLRSELSRNGVSDLDINALELAINEDAKIINEAPQHYGPAVKAWMKDMLSKAVDTSWQIEIGVASSLLANALNNFYGIV